jgi:prepilin signal peptidase PulO-like enzyme (type II secretory pathway)
MYIFAFVLIFFLGTIIGSFLNVVIYRFNTGKSMVKGRSICMTCNKNLRWYELIPIFSFLIQHGKCRRCAVKISEQYPLVEFGTGLLFVLLAFHFMPVLSFSYWSYIFLVVLYAYIFSLLIVISVYDIKHKIIPNKLVYMYAIVSFLTIFIAHGVTGGLSLAWPSIWALFSGPIFALPFAFLWLVSRGKWMGLGDAKLILGIGWLLGPMASLAGVIIAFWLGAIVSLFVMFFSHKKIGMKTEIPFAPFLIIGTLIVFFFNLNIISLVNLLHF